jgi:hypothetical protein
VTNVTGIPVQQDAKCGSLEIMYRIVCGGIMISLVVMGSPAMADSDLGVGTEVGASWAPTRTAAVSRSEAPMRTVGVTRSTAKAVDYLLELADARIGGYWGQCLKLADDAYMPKGPRLGTAFDQWRRAKDAGVAHPKDRNPPVGAQMFWDPGHSAGHIATYVGDERAVTNMPDGTVKAIKWRAMNEWGPYLGWAPPYYK